jgi:glycosyltransferase involved in cell wall biosynthesis
MTSVLVWQWGRRGGGPRIAVELAEALRRIPGVHALLSLSDRAEILAGPSPPVCELPVATYGSLAGLLWRVLTAPAAVVALRRRLRRLQPNVAICAMPGPLDLLLLTALRRRPPEVPVKIVVVVHDAEAHPGDGFPLLMKLQRLLLRRADILVTLSAHVAESLLAQHVAKSGARLAVIRHPPRHFGPPPPPPFAHGGRLRLLFFGRLLPYKGLDLLAEALRLLGPRDDLETRIVGSGPEHPALAQLRELAGVAVENRWVAEPESGEIIAWADALVLPYREASQSGAAAAAVAARRFVVATRVGGLTEQVQDHDRALLCDPDPASLAAALAALLAKRQDFLPEPTPQQPAADGWRDFAQAILDHAAVTASGTNSSR